MKVLYIEAKQKNLKDSVLESEIKKLPRKLFLAYTIQYKDLAIKIKKQLLKNKIKIEKFQQVLGCSKVNTKLPILLIGTGRFHALNPFLQTPAIYILENNKITKISDKEINELKIKTSIMKFLNAEKIGILVSTKPGQENLNLAIKLKKRIQKQSFIFLTNNIDISQFENFQIDSWINTSCPSLSLDNPDINNYQEILEFLK